MASAYRCFTLILFIAIIGVPVTQNTRIDRSRNTQLFPWYSPQKASQMKSESFSRDTQPRQRHSRTLYDSDYFLSNILRNEPKQKESPSNSNPNMFFVKRESNHETFQNSADDANLFTKDKSYQTSSGFNKDARINSKRQTFLNQDTIDSAFNDYQRDSGHKYSDTDAYYDADYVDDVPKQEVKRQPVTTTTEDSLYENGPDNVAFEEPQPAKSPDAKRAASDLTPEVAQQLQKKLKEELDKVLHDNNTCSNCAEIQRENEELKSELMNETYSGDLLPGYMCDQWFVGNRTCWLDRNIGDTVTFVLLIEKGKGKVEVQWRQEFHIINSNKRRIYNIDPVRPMWNVVVGSRGHELRLSPITEIDIDSNSFSAVLLTQSKASARAQHKVNFRIKLIPLDQGFIYPGETLMLNMRRATLPTASLQFKWYMEGEGEGSTLPSNMRLSPGGEVLVISELRQEQEGNITCSVFTNKGFFATKQRYMLREIKQRNNKLLFQTTPSPKRRRKKRSVDDEVFGYEEELMSYLRNADLNGLAGWRELSDEEVEQYKRDYGVNDFYWPSKLVEVYLDAKNEFGLRQGARWRKVFQRGPLKKIVDIINPGQYNLVDDPYSEKALNGWREVSLEESEQYVREYPNPKAEHYIDNKNRFRLPQIGVWYTKVMKRGPYKKIVHVRRPKLYLPAVVISNVPTKPPQGVGQPKDGSNQPDRSPDINSPLNSLSEGVQVGGFGMPVYPDQATASKQNVQKQEQTNAYLSNGNSNPSIGSPFESNLQNSRVEADFGDEARNSQINQQNIFNSNAGSDRMIQDSETKENLESGIGPFSRSQMSGIGQSNLRQDLENDNLGGKRKLGNRSLLAHNLGAMQNINQGGQTRQSFIAEDDETIEDGNRNRNKIENIVMGVDRRPGSALARADDSISKLIASCTSDLECAPDAQCVPGAGFCRCTLGFQGNGFFCWAEVQLRSSGIPLKRDLT